jgi:hypothetical protein
MTRPSGFRQYMSVRPVGTVCQGCIGFSVVLGALAYHLLRTPPELLALSGRPWLIEVLVRSLRSIVWIASPLAAVHLAAHWVVWSRRHQRSMLHIARSMWSLMWRSDALRSVTQSLVAVGVSCGVLLALGLAGTPELILPSLMLAVIGAAYVVWPAFQPPDVVCLGASTRPGAELQVSLAYELLGFRVVSLLRPFDISSHDALDPLSGGFLRTREEQDWPHVADDLMALTLLAVIDARTRTSPVTFEARLAMMPHRAFKTIYIVGAGGERPALDGLIGTVPEVATASAFATEEALPRFVSFILKTRRAQPTRTCTAGDLAEEFAAEHAGESGSGNRCTVGRFPP